MIKKIANSIKNKLKFWTNLKRYLVQYGLPFLVILLIWEVIEDVIFPIIFYLMGQHVHSAFFAAIPVAWIMCLHPIAVPIMWSWYCFIWKKKKTEPPNACDHEH
jgi:hypothetical protein